jgi:hypothetical protein
MVPFTSLLRRPPSMPDRVRYPPAFLPRPFSRALPMVNEDCRGGSPLQGDGQRYVVARYVDTNSLWACDVLTAKEGRYFFYLLASSILSCPADC